jgi:hypothetical protein
MFAARRGRNAGLMLRRVVVNGIVNLVVHLVLLRWMG